MRKFQFSLEGVSRVREQLVKSRELELAKATHELVAAEAARHRLADALKRSLRAAPDGAVVDVTELLALERDRRRLATEMKRENVRIETWLRRVETERMALLHARRQAEAVEKLREKRYLEFVRSVIREEQKLTDEVAGRMRRELA